MSIESWKKEFIDPSGTPETSRDAIEETLLKLTGLLPENMKKHEVEWHGNNSISDRQKVEYRVWSFKPTCSFCIVANEKCNECYFLMTQHEYCMTHSANDSLVYDDDPKPAIELMNQMLDDLDQSEVTMGDVISDKFNRPH